VIKKKELDGKKIQISDIVFDGQRIFVTDHLHNPPSYHLRIYIDDDTRFRALEELAILSKRCRSNGTEISPDDVPPSLRRIREISIPFDVRPVEVQWRHDDDSDISCGFVAFASTRDQHGAGYMALARLSIHGWKDVTGENFSFNLESVAEINECLGDNEMIWKICFHENNRLLVIGTNHGRVVLVTVQSESISVACLKNAALFPHVDSYNFNRHKVSESVVAVFSN